MTYVIILLAVLGLIMIAAEVFVPGLVLGIIGGLSLIAAVILAYAHYGPAGGNFALLGIGLVGVGGFLFWVYFMPRSPVGRRLTLTSKIKGPTQHPDFTELVEKTGEALTPLRPAGAARIDGKRIDVVADSGMIEPGEQVRVIRVEGARVVVRKVEA